MRTALRLVLVLAMTLAALAAAPAAFAAGTASPETQHFSDTQSFHDIFPCIGAGSELAQVDLVENGVFHITQMASGGFHVTGTVVGTFTADPDNPALPNYTGRFTEWFGGNDNARVDEASDTFSATGRAVDGSGTVGFRHADHVTAGQLDFSGDEPVVVSGLRSQHGTGDFVCTGR